MPSSTSSSRERPVEGPWVLTWGLAALVVLAVLGTLELRLRDQGYTPSTNLDNDLWAVQRHKVYWPDRTPVVLVGASRISAGFSPRTFNEAYPGYRAIMLARAGKAPPALLFDLADDEDFDEGVVVVSMFPEHMTKRRRNDQRSLVKAYAKRTENYGFLDNFANRQIQAHIEDTLVFRSPSVDLEEWMLAQLGSGEAPEQNYARVHADTSRSLDYSRKDIGKHRTKRIRKHRKSLRKHSAPKPKRWRRGTRKIDKAIDRLIDRGIEVVVVRYPTCGEFYELDEKHYPRKKYWDVFAKHTRAKTIHFEDYESLRNYDCPDSSHLDYKDVPEFTRALGKVMEELGVIAKD